MDDDLIDLLVHGMKRGGIRIIDPRNLAERFHVTSVEAYEALVESLLGGG